MQKPEPPTAYPVAAYPVSGGQQPLAAYPAQAGSSSNSPIVVAQPVQQQPIVIQATIVQPPYGHAGGRWHRGLFDAASEPAVCLMGWCCPCVLFGMNEQKLDPGSNCVLQGSMFFCVAAIAAIVGLPYCW